jgi:hypothetical protein
MCAVPDPAIRIDLRIGGLGQRTVSGLPVGQRGCGVDRRSDERVAKAHPRVDLEETRRLRRRGCLQP